MSGLESPDRWSASPADDDPLDSKPGDARRARVIDCSGLTTSAALDAAWADLKPLDRGVAPQVTWMRTDRQPWIGRIVKGAVVLLVAYGAAVAGIRETR